MSKNINGTKYKRGATVYVRQGKTQSIKSKENKVYNALDRLEKIMRAVSAVNRAIVGDRDMSSRKNKKRLKSAKKYAKYCKKNGMLVLKKQPAVRYAKPAKSLKRAKGQ